MTMLSPFKKQKTKALYFVGQKPNERIANFIIEFVKPIFDKHQFEFQEKSLVFKKIANNYEQNFYIKKSIHNSTDSSIRFDIIVSLLDKSYLKLHQELYKTKANSNILFGSSVGHIKNWDNSIMDNVWYDINSTDNDLVFNNINYNLTNVLFPLLDKLSNRQNAIKELRKTCFNVCPILFDYCIIENDYDTARLIIQDFEFYLTGNYQDQHIDQIEEYEIRKSRIEKLLAT